MPNEPFQNTEWATSISALKAATDDRFTLGWQTVPGNLPGQTGEVPNLQQQNFWMETTHLWKTYFQSVLRELSQSAPEWDGITQTVQLVQYLESLSAKNENTEVFLAALEYEFTVAAGNMVVSPSNNRLYFPPVNFGDSAYFDVPKEEPIGSGITPGAGFSDVGLGSYHAGLDRIYWAYGQPADLLYTQCGTAQAIAFAHGVTVPFSGVPPFATPIYSPNNDRMYFVPRGLVLSSTWFYINSSGGLVGYNHGFAPIQTDLGTTLYSGTYCPSGDKIYMAWGSLTGNNYPIYVIDALNASVGTIDPPSGAFGRYYTTCFSPRNNKIYYFPYSDTSGDIVFVDCATGVAGSFDAGILSETSPLLGGGIYSPLTNRIYVGRESTSDVYYLDCDTEVMVQVADDSPPATSVPFFRGAYSATDSRIYMSDEFTPSSSIRFIQETGAGADLQWGGNPLFNKGG